MNPAAPPPLCVLFIEDNAADVELGLRELRRAGYDPRADVAQTPEELQQALGSSEYDVVLADYRLPGWTGLDALEMLRNQGCEAPLILVTGSLGEEKAVECVKQGVTDYVLKERLARLPVAVRRAIEEREWREARRRVEQALRESEASYRSLVRHAVYPIFRCSPEEDRFLAVNPALVEMLGYGSEAEVLSLRLCRGVCRNPEAWATVAAQYHRAELIKDIEVEWKRRDGAPILVRLSGRRVPDERGAPCLEATAENITERRRAEQRIVQLNRLYSVLGYASQAIVRIHERDRLFREICRIAVEHGSFRMAWIGLVDPATGQVRPVAHHGAAEGYLEKIRISIADEPAGRGPAGTALRTGRRSICEDILNDPRMLPWRDQAAQRGYRCCGSFPFQVQGRPAGALNVYSSEQGFFDEENVALLEEVTADVSFALENLELEAEKRRADEEIWRLAAIVESSEVAIVGALLDGTITSWNAAAARMYGFTASEALGQPLELNLPPDRRDEIRHALEKLRRGESIRSFETVRLHKDGRRIPVLLTISTVRTRAGEITGVSAIARDITARKRLEHQLRRKNEELERQNRRVQAASRMKDEFLANMSHELRSPLNGIIGFAELMYDGKLGPVSGEHKEYLGDILSSARHLLRLINNILDLAKIEAGRLEFQLESVSLEKIVREVAEVLRAVAVNRGVQVETQVAPEAGFVVADAAKLKQVLYNYLSNALKFTPAEGRVQVRVQPEDAHRFRIEVEDTGIGIAPEDAGRLFVEFQQLDAGTAKRYQGSGLGLALTKRIVEAQGGRVGVRSTPGEGSVFYAVLPRVFTERPAAPAAPSILVIQDDAAGRAWLARVLRHAGYEVETAATGAAALAKCGSQAYAAITLDLLLPDSSGWEVLHAIRAEGPNRATPVIVVSVAGDGGAGTVFPIQDFLSKPLEQEELLDSLLCSGIEPDSARSILVIERDPAAREAVQTALRERGYRVVCRSAADALEPEAAPAAVLLDLLAPDRAGLEFLLKLHRTPDGRRTPVIVWSSRELTGGDREELRRLYEALARHSGGGRTLLEQLRAHLPQPEPA